MDICKAHKFTGCGMRLEKFASYTLYVEEVDYWEIPLFVTLMLMLLMIVYPQRLSTVAHRRRTCRCLWYARITYYVNQQPERASSGALFPESRKALR